jgi:sulfate permease, SulP family
MPNGPTLAAALTTLVLAQIPLTFGNSIVATADAEGAYFGERARRVRPGRLAASICGADLFAGLTSGLPVCHGAGGVTAHYRLGARTAASTMMVGVIYVSLALVLGASLPVFLHLLVPAGLAGMLMFVAIEHGMLAARLERLDDRLIAAGIGLVTVLSGNLAIGAAAGIAALSFRRAMRSIGWATALGGADDR